MDLDLGMLKTLFNSFHTCPDTLLGHIHCLQTEIIVVEVFGFLYLPYHLRNILAISQSSDELVPVCFKVIQPRRIKGCEGRRKSWVVTKVGAQYPCIHVPWCVCVRQIVSVCEKSSRTLQRL